MTTADQLDGGAGIDTLKVYLNAADTGTGQPVFKNIENVWANGGVLGSVGATGYTAATGTTGLVIEAPVADTNATFTLAGQELTLKSYATTAATTTTVAKGATATQTSQKITLDGVTDNNATATLNTVDVTGAGITTLNLVATGANSEVNLDNTGGAAIRTINISGDKNLTANLNTAAFASAVTKIDASSATGNVLLDTSAGAATGTFAFTGGSGNDRLELAAGDVTALTSAAQLDGGAGTDTIRINDVGALTAGIYSGLNAVKNFEVLSLGTTGATVDASQLTSIKSFETSVATTTINNVGTGSSLTIGGNTTAVNLGAAVGNTALDITLGSTTAAGFITAALNTTGLTNLNLTVNGTSLQTITALGNSDNTNLTIKGAADLTITTALAGTTTGSKVDASALTGKLTVTGSTQADVLIGGSNDDSLTSNGGADTLTGNGGVDTFVVAGSGITAATAVTITDFTTKIDKIEFNGAAGSSTNYSEGLAPVASFAAALAAANAALNVSVRGTSSGNPR